MGHDAAAANGDGISIASKRGVDGGCKDGSNSTLLNYDAQCSSGQQNEEVTRRNCEDGDSSGSPSVCIDPQHEVSGHCRHSKRMRLADNEVHIGSICQVPVKKAWLNLSGDGRSAGACSSFNFTERHAAGDAADGIASNTGVGDDCENGSKYLKPSYEACSRPPGKNKQLNVLTSISEEVGDDSTTIVGSSLTAEVIDPAQDAAFWQHEFAGLFRCSKKMRLADDDIEVGIPSVPQVLEQSASAHGNESDNKTSNHNMFNQMCSRQSSLKMINEVATSNFDVGSSSGTSNSVINGLHNGAAQSDTGSMDVQSSHVQDTNLGDSANEQQTLKSQNLVEGSDYQGCGKRDNSTFVEDVSEDSYCVILPVTPVTYAIAKRRAYRAKARGGNCDGSSDEGTMMSAIERWEIEIERAALSEETIMKRFVTRNYVPPSAAIDNLEPSSGLDYSEQICGICMAGYENQDKIGVLYYCPHEFHADCLKAWLRRQNTCPICRGLALVPAHIPYRNQYVDVHRAFFLPPAKAVKLFPFFENILK